MQILRAVQDVRRALGPARATSRIALVPTMGALHDGHLALFASARRAAGIVVATIFVNPSQFADATDLATYPRDEVRDAQLASAAGVDVLFVPCASELYPPGFATWVQPESAAEGLEGDHRPGHFRGVATICLKLFSIVQPHVAFFGQKDAQQLAVIRQLVRDFNLDLEICAMPTVRDRDGLAMSSRNARLSGDDRARALAIPLALDAGLGAYRDGRDPVAAARVPLADVDVDYVAVESFDGQPTSAIAAQPGLRA